MFRPLRLCLLTGLLLGLPAAASANPRLAGVWIATVAPGATMMFNFNSGFDLGNGVWRGSCIHDVTGFVMPRLYELRMFNGYEGTLTLLSSQYDIGYTVGNVNFATQTLTYKNVNYTHRPGLILAPNPLVIPLPSPEGILPPPGMGGPGMGGPGKCR